MERLRLPLLLLLVVAALNVIVLVFMGSYDLRLGPIHLPANSLFKPILYLNAAFLLAWGLGREEPEQVDPNVGMPRWTMFASTFIWFAYSQSFGINLHNSEWSHRFMTSGRSPLAFFAETQYDGYYRPIGFLSLWLDNALFGEHLWAYHIQSFAIHLLNGFLVARLGLKLGLTRPTAQWAGLLFVCASIGFEPAISPGSRFDSMAAAFILFALERGLAGAWRLSLAAFVLGVLSKESAYCFPLLIAALWLGGTRMEVPEAARVRLPRLLGGAIAVTAVLLLVRVAVYGDLGGYPDDQTGARGVNFALSIKTFTSIPTRLPSVLYAINTRGEYLFYLYQSSVIVHALTLVGIVATGAAAGSRSGYLLLILLCSLPALNVIGWINPAAQSTRYLYLPAVWLVLCLAHSLTRMRRGKLCLGGLLISSMLAAQHNTRQYEDTQFVARTEAYRIAPTCKNAACCRTLSVTGVPGEWQGIIFLRDELLWYLQQQLPGVRITFDPQPADACTVTVPWTRTPKR